MRRRNRRDTATEIGAEPAAHSPEELYSQSPGAAGRTNDGTSPLERAADPRGTATTDDGEVFQDSDFYPGGLPEHPDERGVLSAPEQ